MKPLTLSVAAQLSWLERRTGIARLNCLNCVQNCDDHGLLDFKSAVQYMKHFIFHFSSYFVEEYFVSFQSRNILSMLGTFPLERFSNDCRKTKTKAITPTNHNRNEQRDEPITVPSNHMKLARRAGKMKRIWCDWFWFWFWFCFSLVEKLA